MSAITAATLPRTALIWLLLSVVAALVPHSSHLPWVFWVFAAFVMGWRWLMHQGRLPYPGVWAKVIAVVLTIGGIWVGFRGDFSIESAVAFFVATGLLKLMEMKTQRDAYVVVFLGYFLAAAGFLFDQGLVWGAYGILVTWLLTATLVSLHMHTSGVLSREDNRRQVMGAIKQSSILLAASLPMMLAFYLLFPRFGPLWSVNLQSNQAKTGLSNQVSPGDIAKLTRSEELVMRVSFFEDDQYSRVQNSLPEPSLRYWRGLVLDRYDGRTWSISSQGNDTRWYPKLYSPDEVEPGGVRYEVIQEPSADKRLYTLRNGTATQRGHGMTLKGLLISQSDLYQRVQYRGLALANKALVPGFVYPGYDLDLSRQEYWHNLQLPDDSNPQAREWAAQLAQQYRPEALIQFWLNHFNQQAFYYSLSPPQLGVNDIDEFLFGSRTGFCAHYAGSLTFLARAAGIPARMVAGYQGGEWNEKENYLTIRQYDAHAWVELWFEAQGWVRVDPTAAVAPERIDLGMEAIFNRDDVSAELPLFSGHQLRKVDWINDLRMEFERLNYLWYRWVLSYDDQSRRGLLSRWTTQLDWKTMVKQGSILLLTLATLFALWRYWIWLKNRPPALTRAWQQLHLRGLQVGVVAQASDTPLEYLQRVADKKPALAEKVRWLKQDVERLLYMPPSENQSQLERRTIKSLKGLAKLVSRDKSRS